MFRGDMSIAQVLSLEDLKFNWQEYMIWTQTELATEIAGEKIDTISIKSYEK